MKFNNHQFCNKLPFVIYADFESLSCPIRDGDRFIHQKAISYGLYIHSLHPHILESGYHTYTGYDCMEKFVRQLIAVFEIIKSPFKGGTILPVFFHNGSNYDFHFFITELMKYSGGKEKVNVLAKSKEEYISISYGSFYNKMVFLDSYRFLQKSLGDVAKTLDCHMKKGIFPYEYVDSLEKLVNTTSLPPKEDFYSSLTQAGITDEEYRGTRRMEQIRMQDSAGLPQILSQVGRADSETSIREIQRLLHETSQHRPVLLLFYPRINLTMWIEIHECRTRLPH